jgi:hypothetical protein
MNDEPDVSLKQPSFVSRSKNSFSDVKEESVETRDYKREINAAAPDASFFSRNSTTSCVLQIKTIVDSVIAGRTLYLSTRLDHNPEQRRQAIVSSLCDAVAIARKKALVQSSFQKTQEQVRWVQGSLVFQTSMAILIMLVSACEERGRARNERRGGQHAISPPRHSQAHPRSKDRPARTLPRARTHRVRTHGANGPS